MRKQKVAIPTDIRKFVLARDGYKCRYCGSNKLPLHIDHVYPESKGGETSIENTVTACARCNSKKHAHVGIWPKPIGYFKKTPVILFKRPNTKQVPYAFIAMLAAGGAIASIHVFFDMPEPINSISVYGGLAISVSSLLLELGWRIRG